MTMKIEVDERGGQVPPQQFEDADGYVMPLPPASGPRRIPLGDFPTGPEVGTKLPDVLLLDTNPLDDIKNTQTIWRVITGVWLFDPENLHPPGTASMMKKP